MNSISKPALDFAILYVSDLEASLAYFTETLGFSRVPEEDAPTFRYLRSGKGGMDFALLQAAAQTPPAGTTELYFATPDLEGLHAAWTSKGAEATPIMARPFGSIFSTHSPDGHPMTMMLK